MGSAGWFFLASSSACSQMLARLQTLEGPPWPDTQAVILVVGAPCGLSRQSDFLLPPEQASQENQAKDAGPLMAWRWKNITAPTPSGYHLLSVALCLACLHSSWRTLLSMHSWSCQSLGLVPIRSVQFLGMGSPWGLFSRPVVSDSFATPWT